MPARPSRSAPWGAAILLAAAAPAAGAPSAGLHPSGITISPSPTVVPGTVVTVSFTLATGAGTTTLGRLRARDASVPACDNGGLAPGSTGITGDYEVDASNPSLVSGLLASATCADFQNAAGTSQPVSWSFTAQATGTVSLSVLAHDEASGTTMGCADPNGCYAATMFTGTGDLCAVATITIVNPGASVTLTVDPDGPGGSYGAVGDHVVYQMTEDEIHVSATLTNPSGSNTLRVDPALDVPVDFVQIYTRTPQGAVTIPASGSQVFVWTIARDPAGNFGYCQPSDAPGYAVGVLGSTDPGSETFADFDVLTARVTQWLDAPDTVTLGATFTVTLYLASVATRDVVFGASATAYVGPNGGPTRYTAGPGPVPAAPIAVGAGATVPVRFTFTATAIGTQDWEGGLGYGDLAVCLSYTSAATAVTQIVGPSPLVASLTTGGTLFAQGRPYQILLTALNTSPTCTLSVDSVAPITYGGSPPWSTIPNNYDNPPVLLSVTVVGGPPCGGLPCTLAAGATAYVDWLASARDCFTGLKWGGTLTGTDGCGGAITRQLTTGPVTVHSPASFVATAALLQPTVLETQTAYVAVTVTPFSFNSTTQFAVTAGLAADPGASIWLSSAPALPTVLTGCGACVASPADAACTANTRSFTWAFLALTKSQSGRVAFSFTLTGQDPETGAPVSVVVAPPTRLQIYHPSTLAATPQILPSGGPGCEFDEGPLLYVAGDTTVDLLWMTFSTTGAGSAGPVASPAPIATFSGNTYYDNELLWTFSPVGAGCIGFTFSIAGWEEGLGATVYASTVSGTTCEPITAAAPGLRASVVTSTVTNAPGQRITVIMTLTDSGGIRLGAVAASATPWGVTCGGGGAAATIANSLLPDSSGGVGGCGDQMFWRWLYQPTTAGQVAFTVTVTCVDQQTLAPYTVIATTPCIRVWDAPPLALSLVSATLAATRGGYALASLSVTNSGQTDLRVAFGSAPSSPTFEYSVLIGIGVKPGQTAVIPAGTSKTIAVSIYIDGAFTAPLVNFSLTTSGVSITDLTAGGPTAYPAVVPGSTTVYVGNVPVDVDLAAASYTVHRGDTVNLAVNVRNPGSTTVLVGAGVQPVRLPTSGFTAAAPGAVTVAIGGTGSLTVPVTVGLDAPFGTAGLTIGPTYSATDMAFGFPTSNGVGVSLGAGVAAITVEPTEELLTIADNPYHVLKGGLPVTVNLVAPAHVKLGLYTILGERVVTLANDDLPAGSRTYVWDGKTSGGDLVASGIYLLRYESADVKVTRKLAVVK